MTFSLRALFVSGALLTLAACTTSPFNPAWRTGWVEQVQTSATLDPKATASSLCGNTRNVNASGQTAVVAVSHLRAKQRVIIQVDANAKLDAGQKVLVNVSTCEMMVASR